MLATQIGGLASETVIFLRERKASRVECDVVPGD